MAQRDNFFQRLTRLFRSGPSIRRKIKGQNYQTSFDSALARPNQGFRGPAVFGKESSPFSVLGGYGILDRISRYAEFSEMEYTPEIGTALNIYADESCSSDEKGKCFHIYSENPEIKKQLEELFYDTLNVEFNLRPWIRNLVKYGDFFLYNEVIPDIGVVNVNPIPVNEIEREEGFDINDPYAIRFRWLTRGNKVLENWQVTHFRIMGNDLFLPYGTSVLESARRIWRQLVMIEDAMLVYRVVRSPERRVFYIDVGNTAPNDIPTFMEAAKAALRSNTLKDAASGRIDYRYNPVAVDEDYFIPIRGTEGGTRIETLAGGQHVSATEDVEYIQKKLFSALSIPRAYLGYDESLSSKATLAQEDIRFSRTINIIQKIIIAEMNKLAMLHLYAKGFDGEDLINFELFLSNPSSVALQQKLALWNDRIDIASKFKESMLVDETWIQGEILGFTPEEINKFKYSRKQDVLYQKELESIAVSAENQERQATTDPFDSSNYQVPGADIPKNPNHMSAPNRAPVNPGEQQAARDISDEELASSIMSFDAEGRVLHASTAPGVGPISATPYATQRRRNEKRRVGMGGDFNLQSPDFARMLDMGGKNQYNVDIYDDEYLGKRGRNESIDMAKALRRAPELSAEMKSMFERMDAKFGINRSKVIVENFEERLDAELSKKDSNDFADILEATESVSPAVRVSEDIDFELLDDDKAGDSDENSKKET